MMPRIFTKPLAAAAIVSAMIGFSAFQAVPVIAQSEAASVDPLLQNVLADARRDADRARDEYRHPAETLAFFGLTPDQTVIEYAPGGGWYTRILAPYLAENGRYIAVDGGDYGLRPRPANYIPFNRSFPAKAADYTGLDADSIAAHGAEQLPDALNGTVDRILIVRMMHNMLRSGTAGLDLMALRKTLKDDGLVGIVQHMAPESAPYSMTDGSTGYLKKSDVIALMELHGFELMDDSFINANPLDDADHEAGVWTLPPVLRLGDKDRARYEAIGESNRMTLTFRKKQ